MKQILAVAGSARRHSNSEKLLDSAIQGLEESYSSIKVQKIVPYELPITPCRSCHGCIETGKCVINDEMQKLYEPFCNADHIIVSAPIYFTTVPGHLKVMIDRFQCLWVRTYRLDQPPTPRRSGMFLCVGGMNRERYFQNSLTVIKTWMSTLNMSCKQFRFYPGIDEKNAILSYPELLTDARRAGEQLASL
jgi:multimeric flavodoxin WrbA